MAPRFVEVNSKGYPYTWILQPELSPNQYSIATEGSLMRAPKFYGTVSDATPEALKLILYAPEMYHIVAELAKGGLTGNRTVLKQAARDVMERMGSISACSK